MEKWLFLCSFKIGLGNLLVVGNVQANAYASLFLTVYMYTFKAGAELVGQ